MSTSLRLMLLGIALMLVNQALWQLFNDFFAIYIVGQFSAPRVEFDLMYSIIPIVGLILVFIGFFKRDRA